MSIKIKDDLIYPCSQIPEYSHLDVYSNNHSNHQFEFSGRIKTKLSVITGSRQIKDYENSIKQNPVVSPTKNTGKLENKRLLPLNEINSHNSSSTPATPLNFDPYLILPTDSKSDRLTKILSFMALGPSNKTQLVKLLKFDEPEFNQLLSTYGQIYNPNDTFLADDIYPNHLHKKLPMNSEQFQHHYILKDKAYKELRPWNWKYYSDNERALILNNCHNALTRLGYLETHPLRRKICDQPDPNDVNRDGLHADEQPKKPALGGGLLVSKKSPFKKSQTESPRLGPTTHTQRFSPASSAGSNTLTSTSTISTKLGATSRDKDTTSPARKVKQSKKRQLSNNSISSSDDENKRYKKEEYTSPSSINEDDYDEEEGDEDMNDRIDKSKKRYHNLTIKFRLKYQEYRHLYNSLNAKNQPNSTTEVKKSLSKLFELHQTLSDWKKQLWKFDNELKLKSDIMQLSKHKKDLTASPTFNSQLAQLKESSLALKQKPTKPKQILNY